MLGKTAPVSMLTLATLLASAPLFTASALKAEEKPDASRQASEQVPDSSVRGTTYDQGPTKYDRLPFISKKKESDTEVRESAPLTVSSSGPKGNRQIVLDGRLVVVDENFKVIEDLSGTAPATPAPSAPTTPSAPLPSPSTPATPPEKPAEKSAKEKAEVETRIRFAIRRLSTSGWREAQIQIRQSGRDAIPFLIDALGAPESETVEAAYHLGGHTKADAGRGPRQRPVSEVCAELLAEIVTTRSNYRGDLPALDQKAWQAWWAANADVVSFGR